MSGALCSPLFSADVVDILRRLHVAGFCLGLDIPVSGGAGLSTEKTGALFERAVFLLLEESHIKERCVVRPFPVMLGDGRTVDLFRLYCEVRGKGGYRSVTSAGSWGSVAAAAGLNDSLGSALKLIYAKYLGVLDRRLREASRRTREETAGREGDGGSFFGNVGEGDGLLSRESLDQKGGSGEGTPSSKERASTWLKECRLKGQLGDGNADADVTVLETTNGGGMPSCLKRKRECKSLADLLDWLRRVAKNSVGLIGGMQVDQTERTSIEIPDSFSQALLLREALFANLPSTSAHDASLSQKRQKVHPSMYNDFYETDAFSEKPRCSQRIISLKKKIQAGCISGTANVSNGESDGDSIESESEGSSDRQYSNFSYVAGIFGRKEKCVAVGADHQASVPEWTANDLSSDLTSKKFFGERIWPPERKENEPGIKQDHIGRGRRGTCVCANRGNVKCIKFHVAEKRFLLKRELGSTFYSMGFHRMGEEVSLTWSEEEERKFKATAQLNPPSPGKGFWEIVSVCFPSKTAQSLVSYYFNVFILQQRSYQNRVTPEEIDSDNDEPECSFLTNAFGRNFGKIHNSKPIICVQNAQCMNLDDLSDTEKIHS